MHHAQEIVDHIYDSGVIIRFLPPYSPDLNPIEEVFSKVKHYSRQNDVVLQSVRVPIPLDCRNSANLNAKAVSFFTHPVQVYKVPWDMCEINMHVLINSHQLRGRIAGFTHWTHSLLVKAAHEETV